MTNPEEGRKWFSRSVASMTNIYSWGTCFTMVPVLVCVIKIIIRHGAIALLRILETCEKAYYLIMKCQYVLVWDINWNWNNKHFQRWAKCKWTFCWDPDSKALQKICSFPTVTLQNFKTRLLSSYEMRICELSHH